MPVDLCYLGKIHSFFPMSTGLRWITFWGPFWVLFQRDAEPVYCVFLYKSLYKSATILFSRGHQLLTFRRDSLFLTGLQLFGDAPWYAGSELLSSHSPPPVSEKSKICWGRTARWAELCRVVSGTTGAAARWRSHPHISAQLGGCEQFSKLTSLGGRERNIPGNMK